METSTGERLTRIALPDENLSHLTTHEIELLTQHTNTNGGTNGHLNGKAADVSRKFRDCSLGILGAQNLTKETASLHAQFPNFRVELVQLRGQLQMIMYNGPRVNFVQGDLRFSKKQQLLAAIRDILYPAESISKVENAQMQTDLVLQMLKNARVLKQTQSDVNGTRKRLQRVVFWGGHSVGSEEYNYCKYTGEQMGLRFTEVMTGGGPGNMRAGLKGNLQGLLQQGVYESKQIGISAPEIIAAEPPNVYVNRLVIMPSIESRLEAFLRLAHGVVVFPGGVGTLEEFLLALAVKMHEENEENHLPLILTAPEGAKEYVNAIHRFLSSVFGNDVKKYYKIVIGNEAKVADEMHAMINVGEGMSNRREHQNDSMVWNGSLAIEEEALKVFEPTHENVSALRLSKDLPISALLLEMRRLCKAIVYGGITAEGREHVEALGKFDIHGDRAVLKPLEELLRQFIAQKRMRADHYDPPYVLKSA